MLRLHWPQWSLPRATAVGCGGSTAIALSSWWVGAVPNSYQHRPPPAVSWLPVGGVVPRTVFYLGLILLSTAWLVVARTVLARGAPDVGTTPGSRRIVTLVLCWALPMMAAMPLSSRDLWAYAAQGNLVHHGLNPYLASPASLAGSFQDNVSPRWVRATAPYGPLGLMVSHLVAAICGNHVVVTVFLTRVTTLAGFGLVLRSLPRIAVALGRPVDRALVLTLANPLTLVLGLGGGHNDLVMVGLMVGAVAALLRPGGAWPTLGLGAALMAAALAVKSPAAIGLAFTVPVWLWHRQWSASTAPHEAAVGPAPVTMRSLLRACAVAVTASAACFTVISLVSGYGLGWVTQVSSSAPIVSWMSLPTGAAMLAKLAAGSAHGATRLDHTMEAFRSAGLGLAALIIVGLWAAAVLAAATGRTWAAGTRLGRGWADRARRFSPVAYLALAMTTIVLLGPSVQPWYFCWPLPFVALLRLRRGVLMLLLGSSIGLVAMIAPAGRGVQMSPQILGVIVGATLVGWAALRAVTVTETGPSASRDHDADGAGTRVRTDGRPHL